MYSSLEKGNLCFEVMGGNFMEDSGFELSFNWWVGLDKLEIRGRVF